MKRIAMNLAALAIIMGGATHLTAGQAAALAQQVCCSGGGVSCCGSACEADATGCSAKP